MNKYYAAFDFDKKRVGFALAAQTSQDICAQDLPLDISAFASHNDENTAPVASPTRAPQDVAVPTEEPVTEDDEEDPVPAPTRAPVAAAPVEIPLDVIPTPDFDFQELPPSETASGINRVQESFFKDNAMVVIGLGVAFLIVGIVLWRRKETQRQRQIDAIIRHAEANSPYRDSEDAESGGSDFVEIDLKTLQNMN